MRNWRPNPFLMRLGALSPNRRARVLAEANVLFASLPSAHLPT